MNANHQKLTIGNNLYFPFESFVNTWEELNDVAFGLEKEITVTLYKWLKELISLCMSKAQIPLRLCVICIFSVFLTSLMNKVINQESLFYYPADISKHIKSQVKFVHKLVGIKTLLLTMREIGLL